MHAEGSNIFLKTRKFGIVEAFYVLALLVLVLHILNNQFQWNILKDSISISNLTAVLLFLSAVAALCIMRVGEAMLFVYITVAVMIYPSTDFLEFLMALFYHLPQILFWIIPNQIFSELM
jgi:hypothetical protein